MISADLLKGARRRAGLTQAELGRRVGRPASQIARWERGAVKPSLETLRALIRACGLELTFGLATRGDSYLPHINRQLALPAADRVERMAGVAAAQRELRERMRAEVA